jgi:hypothetical protein
MAKKKKVKTFSDFTDAHIYAYWNCTKQNKRFKVVKLKPQEWCIRLKAGSFLME